MATLLSPGVSVDVQDQSQYASTNVRATTPLIVVATQENKPDASNTGVAQYTTKANANRPYLITSTRELIQNFGNPSFTSVNGTPVHGYELNEYGLLTAQKVLNQTSRAWVIRADVDTAQLAPSTIAPRGSPKENTYWFDYISTEFGIFRRVNDNWVHVVPTIYSDEASIDGLTGFPKAAFGKDGDVAVVVVANTVTDAKNAIFEKLNGAWHQVGSTAWTSAHPTRAQTAAFTSSSSHLDAGAGHTLANGGDVITISKGLALNETVTIRNTLIAGVGVVSSTADIYVGVPINPSPTFGTFQIDGINVPVQTDTLDDLIATINGLAITGVTAGKVTVAGLQYLTLGKNGNIVLNDLNTTGALSSMQFEGADTLTLPITYKASLSNVTTSINAVVNIGAANIIASTVQDTPTTFRMYVTDNTGSTFTILSNTTTTLLGLTSGTIQQAELFYRNHIQVPNINEARNGDIWVKTTTPNLGANYSVKLYDTSLQKFVVVKAPLYDSNDTAFTALGTGLTVGSLYTQYSSVPGASQQIKRFNGAKSLKLTFNAPNATNAANLTFKLGETAATLNIVTLPLNATLEQAVAAINAVNDPFIDAAIENSKLVILNTRGRDIYLDDNAASLVDTILGAGAKGQYSNWIALIDSAFGYEVSTLAPANSPAANTLWYNADITADILVHTGNSWGPFTGAVVIAASQPSVNDAGSPIVEGDLWISTADLKNFPAIFRRTSGQWIPVDTTDQTTPFGIVFADARPVASGALDADAPEPDLYPAGILLWNTRASTYNVKRFVPNYTFEGVVIGDRWVTESGNRIDGSPYLGAAAQRIVIVRALQKALQNDDLRAYDSRFFNLILTPGYPELLDDMLALSRDRKETAFVIGDVPADLKPDGTSIQNYANSIGTSDANAAIYYPWGLMTNTDGTDVMMPSSAVAAMAYIHNDTVAFPWFAPAGLNRGLVGSVVSAVGYLSDEGEFTPVELSQGQRDTLYVNRINPIAFMPGAGFVVWGQKTLNATASALDRVNVARLTVYLRYQFDVLARPFLFEPNDDLTRTQVQSAFERFLSDLMSASNRALQDSIVICDTSNNTPERVNRNELWVDIGIIPTKSVEFILIPVRVRSQGEDLTV